jgi:hypothetical protein
LADDGADVAQAGEHTVELRLVGDRAVMVVVPSSLRVMSSSPSQTDQWSSRWPWTRIAYVVGAVFIRALGVVEEIGGAGRRPAVGYERSCR